MKIGTITVQNGYNYGASLQAFALVFYLRKHGFNANLIDYRNQTIEKRMKEKADIIVPGTGISNMMRTARRMISEVLFHTNSYSRKKQVIFDNFHKRIMDNTGECFFKSEDLKKLNSYYDGFICGSDQIWNKKITDLDDAFFLKFATDDKKRIAYAPSLGGKSDNTTVSDYEVFKEKLKTVDYISVREENNKSFIENASGKHCEVVVDPVLLLTTEDWKEIGEEVEPILEGEYAVYYPVIKDPKLEKIAFKKAKEMGLQLINPRLVPNYARMKGYTAVTERIIGPIEFVRLIMDAKCIFTNSFHATVFSSLFNKELFFLTLEGEESSRNNRIIEYLKLIGMYQYVLIDNPLIHIKEFQAEEILTSLLPKRKKSVEFLFRSLCGYSSSERGRVPYANY